MSPDYQMSLRIDLNDNLKTWCWSIKFVSPILIVTEVFSLSQFDVYSES